MANFADLRSRKRSAEAEGLALLRRAASPVGLAVAAALAAAAFAALMLFAAPSVRTGEPPAFLREALGRPDSSAPVVPLEAKTDEVSAALKLQGSGGGWKRFEHGVTRATGYGEETVIVDGSTTEQ